MIKVPYSYLFVLLMSALDSFFRGKDEDRSFRFLLTIQTGIVENIVYLLKTN